MPVCHLRPALLASPSQNTCLKGTACIIALSGSVSKDGKSFDELDVMVPPRPRPRPPSRVPGRPTLP